jgi:hypothetical protein
MHWERIRYWQWLVIAGVIGFSIAQWRQNYVDDAIRDLGESLNGQAQFEEALLRNIQGRRQFDDVVVTPELLPDGKGAKRLFHVVRGMYWDGRSDGAAPVWRPAFFVAPVPYTPQFDLTRLGSAGEKIAQENSSIKRPTVLDFLRAVHNNNGVKYRYAWWRGSAYAMWLWLAGCIASIGLALPRVINLTVYGTFSRPPIERRKRLDPVISATAPQDPPMPGPIENADRQARSVPSAEPAMESVAPVRQLQGGPLEPVAEAHADTKEFGAARDDFYPTERRARH